MHLSLAFARLAAVVEPGPPVTEIVPVRPDGHDSSWPPVLVVCVLVVLLGGLFAAVVFLRQARAAAGSSPRPLDG
jgi:hypothetical protein